MARILDMFRRELPNPKQFWPSGLRRAQRGEPGPTALGGPARYQGRGPDRAEADHRLFSLLTCGTSGLVGPNHPKAIPILPTTPEAGSATPTEIGL